MSFEGSVLVARKDTNENWYGSKVSPAEILSGKVTRPAEATYLYRILDDKFGQGTFKGEEEDEGAWNNRDSTATASTSRYSTGMFQRDSSTRSVNSENYQHQSTRSSVQGPPAYGAQRSFTTGAGAKKAPPPIPPKRRQTVTANFAFSGQRDSDLSFQPGDVIEVLQRDGDWWRGRIAGKEGDFPSNYCQ
ncbi:MAG: hypothetical protein SGCHY_003957 [Lobulomycetales sp.]